MTGEFYALTYSDARGVETTELRNDGVDLRMTLRGVEFSGQMLDDFAPAEGTAPDLLAQFTLCVGALCDCTLEFVMALPVLVTGAASERAALRVRIELGRPAPNGSLDREDLLLSLSYAGRTIATSTPMGWFEDALLELQRRMPTGHRLHACFTCAFSDYSPYGNGLFGTLHCFRATKAEYRTVDGKGALFALWDRNAGPVQETWLCEEWEDRPPGSGYRG